MIQLKALSKEVNQVFPDILLDKYDMFLLAHKKPHMIGDFKTLEDEDIDVPWGVIWIDCHAPLIEIRGFQSFEAIKHYLAVSHCPFFSTTCGGFVVFKECKVKRTKLFFIAPNGEEVAYDIESNFQKYWGLRDVLSVQLELIDA
jgi:hypothetical protein